MSWDALDEIDKSDQNDKKWLHDTFNVCGDMKDTIATDLSDWLQSIWFNLGMGMVLQTSFIRVLCNCCSKLSLPCFVPGTASGLASKGMLSAYCLTNCVTAASRRHVNTWMDSSHHTSRFVCEIKSQSLVVIYFTTAVDCNSTGILCIL